MKSDNTEIDSPGSAETYNAIGERFIEDLKMICDKWDFTFETDADGCSIRIHFWNYSPMWIRIDIDPPSKTAFLVGVVRAYEVPHERTDYNELMSLIWAASLRSTNTASVRLLDIPHPALSDELLGRYVVFEKQPPASYISLESPDFELIEKILVQSSAAARNFSFLYHASSGCIGEERCCSNEKWESKIKNVTRWKLGRNEIGNCREFPNWSYFRSHKHGASLFEISLCLTHQLRQGVSPSHDLIIKSQNGHLVCSGAIKNLICKQKLNQVNRLLKIYGGSLQKVDALMQKDGLLLLPTESHLICLTTSGIIALDSEGGANEFLREESKLRLRHQKEATLLHSSLQFQWNQHISDNRFEALSLDLLKREPGVRRAKQIGSSRAPDGGRDIIVDWMLPPSDWEKSTEHQAFILKRVVVQCKAHRDSINWRKIGDAVGTADFHDAAGYLLIAFPDVTPQLIDYLEKVPRKRNIWADWWTPTDIEERLRQNLDIAYRYQDLITIKDNPNIKQ